MNRFTANDAIRMASAITGMTRDEILAPCDKHRRCVHVRAALAVLMHRRGLSGVRIGHALNKDASTIWHILKHWSERREVLDLVDLISHNLARLPPQWHSRPVASATEHTDA